MLLNTFAPPFRLVGGYFIVGILFLILSLFAFLKVDFSAVTSFQTAGFLHIYFVGFVMSIIIGALYQLTSVILEKSFSTIRGAFTNLFVYALGILLMSAGMIFDKVGLLHAGGSLLFLSLLLFAVTYFASFVKNEKKSFAAFALLISSVFLIFGISLGFCLLMIFSGAFSMDFELTLHYHIYFVLGFVFFIVVGVASVLLPMFALAHDLKFTLSKVSLAFYLLGGVLLYFGLNFALVAFLAAILCFVAEAFLILKKRVRKAYDYWNLNIFLSLASFVAFCVFSGFGLNDVAVFFLMFGFLYAFITAHLYKIAPFLIWYHYVAPFVGKTKVPLLDDMIVKRPTYVALSLNALALVAYASGFAYGALVLLFVSVLLVAFNMVHVFKFINFGVKNEG
ncbi:MAG: peptidase M50 [Campylobacter curvus]